MIHIKILHLSFCETINDAKPGYQGWGHFRILAILADIPDTYMRQRSNDIEEEAA
jgi:hypothetical protein